MPRSVHDEEESISVRDTRILTFHFSPKPLFPAGKSEGNSHTPKASPPQPGNSQSADPRVLGQSALAVTIAALLGGGHATAQDQSPTQLPEVLVTGQDDYQANSLSLQKYNGPLLTTPQSASVVTPQLMQDEGVTSLRDALRNVSGISIGAGEGSYQGDNFSIRGFHARSDIYLDGMSDFGNYDRDPFNTQEVEVLKGPSSVEFGRGSSGGVVNIESKSPQLQGFTAGSTEYGTDNTERATLDWDEPISLIPGAAFRLNLMGNHNNVTDRNETMYGRWGAAPSLAFGLDSPTRLTLSYFHQSEDNRPDYGIPWYFDRPAVVDRRNFYGFNSDYFKTDVNIGTIHFEHDFNDNLTLREQFRMARYDKDFRITEVQIPGDVTPATPLDDIDIERSMIDAVGTNKLIDEDINLLGKFETGPIKHTLVTGFEYVRQTDSTTRIEPGWENVPETSLLSPNPNVPFTGFGPTSTLDHVAVNTLSVYLKDTLKLGAWSLLGGVRYDHIQSNYFESVPPTQALSEDVGLVSWRAALVYQPRPNGSIYFSTGTSIHPNITQIALSSETTLPANVADVGIGRNLEFEAGTKWHFFEDRFSLTSAVFLDEQTNPAPVDLDDPIFKGKERIPGFEISTIGHLTRQWQILANYTYIYPRIVSSDVPGMTGLPVLNAPKNTVSAWTTYDLPWNFQIGAGLDALTTRTAANTPDPINHRIQEAPGYIIFNAMLKYRISRNISIQANLTNIGDRYYYDGVHPGHIVPGEGRTLFISTNFKF